MANDTAGLFQTLVAPAAATAAQHLVFQNAFLRAIYWDYKPVVASPYKYLSVTVPTVSEADVADIGAGGLTPTDTAHSAFTITLDRHFSSSWVVKSFDDIRSPQDLSAKYIAPRLEALKRRIEAALGQLLDAQAKQRPYLFADAGQGGQTAAEPPRPGPASGQGGPAAAPGKMAVSRKDLTNTQWMAKHGKALSEAFAADNVHWVD